MSFSSIEKKWQDRWQKARLGEAESARNKKKFFMIFAYPGISGYMHVGHMRGFSYTDAFCRYKRMSGYNVLFPVGTHASGNQAIAFANKIRQKDKDWLEYLKRNKCPSKQIEKLTDAKTVVDYFNNVYVEEYWKKFGFLADWRRFTCTTYEDYGKFIQWQFKKLYDLNLLVQKPYFAPVCVEHGPVAVDPSETDISKGGNAEKMEYTLLKFKLNDEYLVAATLRPETVYGQTNIWVNPNVDYVVAQVDNEKWILSSDAAEKLAYQKDNVKISIIKVKGRDLVGKVAKAPGINRDLIVLPAEFCDPGVGSGIVTSVPSDAPWDYIALKELQDSEKLCKQYGLDNKKIKEIKLIPIIKTKGYSEYPSVDSCKKFGIRSQADKEKLEEATKEVYKAGYHTGVMRESAGKYSGKKVEEAKELIKEYLISTGKADSLHDLSEEVICRCGKKVIIKRIDDQWFIKYSDNELTEKSKHCVEQMTIYPKEYKVNLPGILDWFTDRACARLGNWLGTRLPFDQKWIVEPISDSTLYPAYYVVSKYVNGGKVKKEQLTEEFFDYVFLGKGEDKIASKLNLDKKLLEQIRKDFEYWYPLDVNLGGKEHQTVHFPVFIMNHVAIFAEKFWPKGIFVNWWVTGGGGKISKSKGGAEPIPGAIEKYGVDGMRLYYSHVGSPHVDVIWDESLVQSYSNTVNSILKLSDGLLKKKGEGNKLLERWLVSRINGWVYKITNAFDNFDLRDVANAYYEIYNDFLWYIKRGGVNGKAVKDVLSLYSQLICPIMPHTAEEVWSNLGNKGLVSSSNWPKHDEKKIDLEAEAGEEIIKKSIEDIREVLKLSKISKPKKITLFVPDSWKYTLFRTLRKQLNVTRDIGQLIRNIMKDKSLSKYGGEASKLVQFVARDPSRIPTLVLDQEKELKLLKDASGFIKKEFGADVEVIKADDAERIKKIKADKFFKFAQAIPGRPSIFVS